MILVLRSGKKLDHTTWLKIRAAEKLSGLSARVTQGSYNDNVSASANIHDGGGAVDFDISHLTSVEKKKYERALRTSGLMASIRPAIPKVWSEHIHALDKGNPNFSAAASRQMSLFEKGYDGLKGNRPDQGPKVHVPERVPMNNVQQFRELVQFAINEYGSKVPTKRKFARIMIAACQVALNRGPKA